MEAAGHQGLTSPPIAAVKVIVGSLLKYRGLVAVGPKGTAAPKVDDDSIVGDLSQFNYFRIDSTRAEGNAPRGKRDLVIFLVLAPDGKYSKHGPDLRQLMDQVLSEKEAHDGRLDELVVVADPVVLGKKNMTDVVVEAQKKQAGGPDIDGVAPFFNIYPFTTFSLVVPEHQAVPRHILLTAKEETQLLKTMHSRRTDIPVIFSNDPPIVWAGGREGMMVRIERLATNGGSLAVSYRRIEKAPSKKKS